MTLFLLLLLAADLPAVEGALRLGRQIEARLRVSFLRKIPRLRDRSRLEKRDISITSLTTESAIR